MNVSNRVLISEQPELSFVNEDEEEEEETIEQVEEEKQ